MATVTKFKHELGQVVKVTISGEMGMLKPALNTPIAAIST